MLKFKTEFNLRTMNNPAKFIEIAKELDFRIKYLGECQTSTHSINCRKVDFYAMLDMVVEEANKQKREEKK